MSKNGDIRSFLSGQPSSKKKVEKDESTQSISSSSQSLPAENKENSGLKRNADKAKMDEQQPDTAPKRRLKKIEDNDLEVEEKSDKRTQLNEYKSGKGDAGTKYTVDDLDKFKMSKSRVTDKKSSQSQTPKKEATQSQDTEPIRRKHPNRKGTTINDDDDPVKGWECDQCTLINKSNAKECATCENLAPHLKKYLNDTNTEKNARSRTPEKDSPKKNQDDQAHKKPKLTKKVTKDMEEGKVNEWECSMCTFKNKASAKKCEQCDSLTPHLETSKGSWICQSCTYENSGLIPICEVCSKPRASNDASKNKGNKEQPKPALTPQNTMKEVKSKPVDDDKKAEPPKKSLKAIVNEFKVDAKKPAKDDYGDNDDNGKKGGKKGGKSVEKNDGEKKKVNWYAKKKKGGDGNDLVVEGPLSELTFVFTGILDAMPKRDDLESLIKSLGGRVTTTISKKTSYLVTGSVLEDGRAVSESSKYKKAKDIGTKILSESEFDDFLEKKAKRRLADGIIISIPQSTATAASKPTAAQGQANASANKPIKTADTTLWTTKYAPEHVDQIIGNQSALKEIINWLNDWDDVVIKGNKKPTKFKPGGWANAANPNARACLISGPPGIGKTTSVRLIAKDLGYDIVEQNASDVRNKASLNALLRHLTDNQLLKMGTDVTSKKFVILMDEVDGMSAGDRGGNAILIENIKATKIPIFCICNDRQSQKVRTLANHCNDIKFQRPQKTQIAKRLGEIASKEGMKYDNNALELLCETFGNDIRQILNFMQMWSKKSDTLLYSDTKLGLVGTKKDESVMITNFDAASKLLNRAELNKLTLRSKLDLFFIDYDLIPLLIQENYLSSYRKNEERQLLDLQTYTEAADIIATGDVLSKSIRVHGEWSLMPNFGFLSSVYPCELVSTSIPFPKFPEWFGKSSSTKKIMRETKELRIALAPAITGTRNAVKNEYSTALLNLILYNLKDGSRDDIEATVRVMEQYELNPDMIKEHLVDVQFKGNKNDPYAGVATQTKTAVTRIFNQRHKSSLKRKAKGRRVAADDETTADTHMIDEPEKEPEKITERLKEEDEGNFDEDDTGDYEVEEKVIRGGSKATQASKEKKSEPSQKLKKPKS